MDKRDFSLADRRRVLVSARGMIRALAFGLVLLSAPAWASWEFAGQGAYGEQGAAALGELQYSPQGFWAVVSPNRLFLHIPAGTVDGSHR